MSAQRLASLTRREGLTNEIVCRQHRLVADEPTDAGGADLGPKPTELLAAALASCTAITIELYAERKGWDIGRLTADVSVGEASDGSSPRFEVAIEIPTALDAEQLDRIETIAGKCPVARLLKADGTEVADSVTAAA